MTTKAEELKHEAAIPISEAKVVKGGQKSFIRRGREKQDKSKCEAEEVMKEAKRVKF